MFDTQTSGGLLIAVKKDQADSLFSELIKNGIKDAVNIGEFTQDNCGKIVL